MFSFISKNYSIDFRKSDTNGKSAHSPVYLHALIVSFYVTPLSTDLEKVCGEIFDAIFGFLDSRKQIDDFDRFPNILFFSISTLPNLRFGLQ